MILLAFALIVLACIGDSFTLCFGGFAMGKRFIFISTPCA
jgi:hypothetical protein